VNCFAYQAFDEEKLDYEWLIEPVHLLWSDGIWADFEII
jgi:hypothetical protein